MADNLQIKTEKLIKYGNEKFGLNETTIRGILDNASAGGSGNLQKYHIVQTINGDTCTLTITDFVDQADNNYMATSFVQSDKQKLYIIDE